MLHSFKYRRIDACADIRNAERKMRTPAING
jgi:hypothetical protein